MSLNWGIQFILLGTLRLVYLYTSVHMAVPVLIILHVYLHASVHMTLPVSVRVSLTLILFGQPLNYPGVFYLDCVGSLSGQHLSANPQILLDT